MKQNICIKINKNLHVKHHSEHCVYRSNYIKKYQIWTNISNKTSPTWFERKNLNFQNCCHNVFQLLVDFEFNICGHFSRRQHIEKTLFLYRSLRFQKFLFLKFRNAKKQKKQQQIFFSEFELLAKHFKNKIRRKNKKQKLENGLGARISRANKNLIAPSARSSFN